MRKSDYLTHFWGRNDKQKLNNTIYMGFIACANSVDPDQLAHVCYLIRIYTFCFLVRNDFINHKKNSVDLHEMVHVCLLIWIDTVFPSNKSCIYVLKGYSSIFDNDTPGIYIQLGILSFQRGCCSRVICSGEKNDLDLLQYCTGISIDEGSCILVQTNFIFPLL
jgi:hypothetical protein